MVEWNRVTWYSKWLAVIVFGGTFFFAFYLGGQYQAVIDEQANLETIQWQTNVENLGSIISDVSFACDGGKKIHAQFRKRSVSLELSDGRSFALPQTISASGIRYANKAETFVFWSKGNGAFIQEGKATTYANCSLIEGAPGSGR